MPSIIEKISEAEAQASAIRRSAVLDSRETVAKADENAKRIVDEAREKQRAALAQAESEAEKMGQAAAQKIKLENDERTNKVISDAKLRLPKAEAYILERVVKA